MVMMMNVLCQADMWTAGFSASQWNYTASLQGSETEALVGAAAGDNVLVGSSSVRAATGAAALMKDASAGTAKEATEVSVEVAAGATVVLVGNESTGEISLAGKLSRKQAKNFKQRMNKMKVLYCPSNLVHALMD